jgi:hypothetical protein
MSAPNAAALVRVPTQRVGGFARPDGADRGQDSFLFFFYVREMRPTLDNPPAALSSVRPTQFSLSEHRRDVCRLTDADSGLRLAAVNCY